MIILRFYMFVQCSLRTSVFVREFIILVICLSAFRYFHFTRHEVKFYETKEQCDDKGVFADLCVH